MTTPAPRPHHLHRPHVNLWLVGVVTLSAALIGVVAWVLVDRYAGGPTPEQNATALIDRLEAAISANDANALESIRAEDVVVWAEGDRYAGRANVNGGHFDVKRIAPVTVNGEFASTYEEGSSTLWPYVATFQIRNGRIIRSWEFQEGDTAPFGNALMR